MVANAFRLVALTCVPVVLLSCGSDSPTQAAPDPSAVASVVIRPGRTSMVVGSILQLLADATSTGGAVLPGRTIHWTSERTDVASVTPDGLVTAVATGTAVITASSDGKSATVVLSVEGHNSVVLTFDPGNQGGATRVLSYTNANAVLLVTHTADFLRFRVIGDDVWDWEFRTTDAFAPGTYAWDTGPVACGFGLRKTFTIDSLIWGSGVGSRLVSLSMRFEERCQANNALLQGAIHWRDDDRSVAPGPIFPVPAGLWQPPAGATPASDNFIYLQSDSGDWVGNGATKLYQGETKVTVQAGRLLVLEWLGGDLLFQVMNSLTELKPGYYGSLMRYPFHNVTVGGLAVGMGSSGCNTVSGWVALDRVYYNGGALAGFELRFVQHCGGGTPALRGAVRWGRLSG